MVTEDVNSTKRELCEKLLEPGTVMLVVDARRAGVQVPDHLSHDPKLRLNIDYRFGASMTVDDAGVAATLSFGGDEFDCVLPWESIYVFLPHTGSQPYVFPDDVPEEVLDEIGIESPNREERPVLRVVENHTDAGPEATSIPPDEDAPDPPPAPPAGGRGHLRVVK